MKIPSIYLLVFITLLMPARSGAQVYGYDPIRFSNFETNPAYLASGKYRQIASYTHMGGLPFSDKFSYDALRYSVYSKKHFCGAGIVLNNTQINDSIACRYAAIGAAYRNVLFDVVHARIGFLYKFNQFNNPGGQFTDYTFRQTPQDVIPIKHTQNLNAAVSFSSSRETYFVSLSVLNLQLAKAAAGHEGVSPVYYVLNVGDLAKIADAEHTNISFTAVWCRNSTADARSYFVHIRQDGISLTRSTGFLYGLTAGYNDQGYLQCKPSLGFYNGTRGHGYHSRKRVVVEKNELLALYDFAIPVGTVPRPYKPCWQFSLTHFF